MDDVDGDNKMSDIVSVYYSFGHRLMVMVVIFSMVKESLLLLVSRFGIVVVDQ